jgi:hypothetical protein
MYAAIRNARLVSPTCVEWNSGRTWAATHVRLGDRWIDETSAPADPRCTVFHEAREGSFTRADCGGTFERAVCSEDDAPPPESW